MEGIIFVVIALALIFGYLELGRIYARHTLPSSERMQIIMSKTSNQGTQDVLVHREYARRALLWPGYAYHNHFYASVAPLIATHPDRIALQLKELEAATETDRQSELDASATATKEISDRIDAVVAPSPSLSPGPSQKAIDFAVLKALEAANTYRQQHLVVTNVHDLNVEWLTICATIFEANDVPHTVARLWHECGKFHIWRIDCADKELLEIFALSPAGFPFPQPTRTDPSRRELR